MQHEHMVREIIENVRRHHEYRSRCLNLIASENVTSPLVREVMASDLGHRYAIGFLYTRMYRGCRYIDNIEETTNYLAKALLKAEHVNYVPTSGTVANLVMFNAITQPGDVVVALSVMDGGHSSFRECSRIHGVSMVPIPMNYDAYNVDADAAKQLIARVKPKVVLLGASDILFPHPVEALREAVEAMGATLAYDAAHVFGLIAGGCFQDPLREGAEIITSSIHKTFFGPQGGIILCTRRYAEAIDHSAWQMVNNHHIHRVAGLAITLCEMLTFGKAYATQVVKNAQGLGQSLYNLGVKVLCPDLGFTKSHQLILDVGEGKAKGLSTRLEEANIITNPMPLPWDKDEETCSGIRLGVQELTRLGMRETEMEKVAELIAKVLLGKEDIDRVREDVSAFTAGYQTIHYCFNKGASAYEYYEALRRGKN